MTQENSATGDSPHVRAEAIKELLEEALDDWLPVDQLLWCARQEAERSGGDFRKISVQLLRFLLERKLMVIGELGDEGVDAWTSSVEESVARFVKGCEQYDWVPQGALWWMDITPDGERWLQQRS